MASEALPGGIDEAIRDVLGTWLVYAAFVGIQGFLLYWLGRQVVLAPPDNTPDLSFFQKPWFARFAAALLPGALVLAQFADATAESPFIVSDDIIRTSQSSTAVYTLLGLVSGFLLSHAFQFRGNSEPKKLGQMAFVSFVGALMVYLLALQAVTALKFYTLWCVVGFLLHAGVWAAKERREPA